MEALVRDLPANVDEVRRLFWRDADFRTVCEDYRDVRAVLARLEAASATDPRRVAEYRDLAAELLAEARGMLSGGAR